MTFSKFCVEKFTHIDLSMFDNNVEIYHGQMFEVTGKIERCTGNIVEITSSVVVS